MNYIQLKAKNKSITSMNAFLLGVHSGSMSSQQRLYPDTHAGKNLRMSLYLDLPMTASRIFYSKMSGTSVVWTCYFLYLNVINNVSNHIKSSRSYHIKSYHIKPIISKQAETHEGFCLFCFWFLYFPGGDLGFLSPKIWVYPLSSENWPIRVGQNVCLTLVSLTKTEPSQTTLHAHSDCDQELLCSNTVHNIMKRQVPILFMIDNGLALMLQFQPTMNT